ncbi:MAG TPA: hypothetical protein VGU67_11910 [Edaphobacter sp.]|nr:hypothetical protein [Edaphobacter sp.]
MPNSEDDLDDDAEYEDEVEDEELSAEEQAKIDAFLSGIAAFEKAESQMLVLIREFAELSKKKPDGAINKFKLKYLNQIIGVLNDHLKDNKPFEDFTLFDEDAIPSNSDVKMMLSQYASQTLAFRVKNTRADSNRNNYYWIVDGEQMAKTVEPRERNAKLYT